LASSAAGQKVTEESNPGYSLLLEVFPQWGGGLHSPFSHAQRDVTEKLALADEEREDLGIALSKTAGTKYTKMCKHPLFLW
jgi:hypothetical protein